MSSDTSESAPPTPTPDPRPTPGPNAFPSPTPRAVGEDDDPADDARTPDEYTEPPGSHRRPSDGAALDVGG